jgi:REP element-mobilizing transposase RayT
LTKETKFGIEEKSLLEDHFMPRQARLDSPGTLHHVMIRGINKRRIFDDEQDRKEFVRRLAALAEGTCAPIYAWALMPNHAHLLVCSGAQGLAQFMRRLLTGYAVSYNLRHRRHGHLFENRYKSIVCDGDSYFTELVRYIHLNPLRVELVKDVRQLERYPYCGHGTILGTQSNPWQDRDSVLAQFGKREAEAREAYRGYVVEGVALGRRPELVGGGRSRWGGEWFSVDGQRRRRERESSDERILGSGQFVERVLREADARTVRQDALRRTKRHAERRVAEGCKKNGVSLTELRSGSRRGRLPEIRAKIVRGLVEDYGLTLAEVARQVGISTSGVSKIMARSLSR